MKNNIIKYLVIFFVVGVISAGMSYCFKKFFGSNINVGEQKDKIENKNLNLEKNSDGYYVAYDDEYIKIEYGDFNLNDYTFEVPTRYTNKTDYNLKLDIDTIKFNNVSHYSEWFGRNLAPKEVSEHIASIPLAWDSYHHFNGDINEITIPFFVSDSDSFDYEGYTKGFNYGWKVLETTIVKFSWNNKVEYEKINLGDLVFSDDKVDVYHYIDFNHDYSSLHSFDDVFYVENKTDNILEFGYVSGYEDVGKKKKICTINDINWSFYDLNLNKFILPKSYKLLKFDFTTGEDTAIENRILDYFKSGNVNATFDLFYYEHIVKGNTFSHVSNDESNRNYIKLKVSDYNFKKDN